MNHYGHRKLPLVSRNEGKLKSYESCVDVRAWSHDPDVRYRYLREWMKGDMPVCIIPVCTLSYILRSMSPRCCRRATPCCRPGCKSKELLESIRESCEATRNCLRNDENFDKYFDEEEFETCHWPCDRCLDALKSIKMFWRIIVDKILNINICKNDCKVPCRRTNSVREVARAWQRDMVQNAMVVHTIQSKPNCIPRCPNKVKYKSCMKKDTGRRCEGDSIKLSRRASEINCSRSERPKINVMECASCSSLQMKEVDRERCTTLQKCNRETSTSVITVDVASECCSDFEEAKVNSYLISLKRLRQDYNKQKCEIDRLRKENDLLRLELQKFRRSKCKWSSGMYCSGIQSDVNNTALTLKPFECDVECIDSDKTRDVESEMIITMKKCKNERYRHVSMVQVLHKSNDPNFPEENFRLDGPCCKNEDPIEVLSKVQNTLGAIVRREMSIAHSEKAEVEASFQSNNCCSHGSHTSLTPVSQLCTLG